MKLSDFILLNEQEKKVAVLHEGVLVAKRHSYDYLVLLFQLENGYVETYCNKQKKVVEEYRMFDSNKTSLLNPYLEGISIDDLLN